MPVVVYSSEPEIYRRIWAPFALWGAGLIAFGAVIILWPTLTGRVLVTGFGLLALLAGVTQLASAVIAHRKLEGLTWLPVVTGVLALTIGAVTLLFPTFIAKVFAFVIGLAAFAWGVSDIGIGWTGRAYFPMWRWHMVRGVITAGAGVFLMVRPLESLVAAAWVVGIWAAAIGLLTFILGMGARSSRGAGPRRVD